MNQVSIELADLENTSKMGMDFLLLAKLSKKKLLVNSGWILENSSRVRGKTVLTYRFSVNDFTCIVKYKVFWKQISSIDFNLWLEMW